MHDNIKIRVALYARFSSHNQNTMSINAQIRAMKKYCKDKINNYNDKSYTIVETYIDEAKSATTDNRPAFQQMIEDSKKHIFDIILVHKLDRFSRNRYDSAIYKRELKRNGVKVFSVLENLDDSPEAVMLESVLEGMSEYYSVNLKREVLKGMYESAALCKFLGGTVLLGYDVNSEKKYVINEYEQEIVKTIFNLYDLGYSYKYLINHLNNMGFKTKRNNPFGKNSLRDILINRRYVGEYTFCLKSSKNVENKRNNHSIRDESEVIRIPGGMPQIIDLEQFDRVQKRMEENRNKAGKYNTNEYYLLSGLVRCSCGKIMSGNTRHCGRNKSKYSTYRCPNHGNGCSNKEVNIKYLNDFVLTQLKKTIFTKRKMKAMVENYSETIDNAELTLTVGNGLY